MAILFADIVIAKQVLAGHALKKVHVLEKCSKTPLPRDKLFALEASLEPCIRSAPNLVRIPGSCRSSMTALGRKQSVSFQTPLTASAALLTLNSTK